MARFALVCAAALSLAALGACAREPDPEKQVPADESAAPAPPLTTEMVGGTAAQPTVAPVEAPAAPPQGATTTPVATPATAPAADTAHADSGHTGH
jgi:hypothetical protein